MRGYDAARRAYEMAEPGEERYEDCPSCEGSGSELAEDRDGVFEVACALRGDGTVRS